jgi:hypothetical protein
MQIFVMPAWIAGIQVCKDASGNIHVNLDSSTPCWNDAVEGFCFELIELLCPVFSKEDTEFAEIGVLLDQKRLTLRARRLSLENCG